MSYIPNKDELENLHKILDYDISKEKWENDINGSAKYVKPDIENTFANNIKELLKNSKKQNELLLEQNRLLQEENEHQKQQIIESQKEKEKVEKRLKKERVVFWITFIIPTIISILALIKG